MTRRLNMFKVTVDLFSGRPNPSWIVEGPEAKRILKTLATNRGAIDTEDAGFKGLGFRGINLELLTDETSMEYDLPRTFGIANGATSRETKGFEIAEQLINRMHAHSKTYLTDERITPLDKRLQKHLLDRMRRASVKIPKKYEAMVTTSEEIVTKEFEKQIMQAEEQLARMKELIAKMKKQKRACCTIEVCRVNLPFWNSDANVCWNNNCYNYATNRKTNTFAQPGRGSGHPNNVMQCANVSQAARDDGAHNRYDCFPDSEKPRPLMALVVDPDWDYHWYRYQYICIFTAKFHLWGHKPGHTKARITDNSDHLILNPETCDRGGYTDFCGYFYGCKSMKVA